MRLATTAWVAPTATILGDVELGEEASVWFQAVLRGDLAPIRIGDRSNIQDGCILHVDEEHPCVIGKEVTVGHGAIIHGATVEDLCLIGISATILNGARIGTESVIGAKALIPEGKVIPPGSLVMGVPGRVVRELTGEERALLRVSADNYVRLSRRYQQQ